MSAQPQRGGNRNLDSYVGVHTRVEKFRLDHPTARLTTVVVKDEPLTVRCEIYLDGNDSGVPTSSGMADESGGMGGRGNSTLEKVETAAVGRALAFLGYEVKEGIASREDVSPGPRPVPQEKSYGPERRKLTDRVQELCTLLGYDVAKTAEALSRTAKKSDDELRRSVIPSLEKLLARKKEDASALGPDDEKERSYLAAAIYRELNELYKTDAEIAGFLRKNYEGKEPKDMALAELRRMASDMEVK
jgi:hypothetical protein